MKPSKIPTWYLLQFADELLTDASRIAPDDPALAECWVDQAAGIAKALATYHKNGGWMEPREVKRLAEIEHDVENVADIIPSVAVLNGHTT